MKRRSNPGLIPARPSEQAAAAEKGGIPWGRPGEMAALAGMFGAFVTQNREAGRRLGGPGARIREILEEMEPVLEQACAAVCPEKAIDLNGWALEQYELMVDAIVAA